MSSNLSESVWPTVTDPRVGLGDRIIQVTAARPVRVERCGSLDAVPTPVRITLRRPHDGNEAVVDTK